MVNLQLKVRVGDSTKTVQLNSSLLVYDACKTIFERESVAAHLGKRKMSSLLGAFFSGILRKVQYELSSHLC